MPKYVAALINYHEGVGSYYEVTSATTDDWVTMENALGQDIGTADEGKTLKEMKCLAATGCALACRIIRSSGEVIAVEAGGTVSEGIGANFQFNTPIHHGDLIQVYKAT